MNEETFMEQLAKESKMTRIERTLLFALKDNKCTYERMNRYFTKETLRVNICRLRKKGFKIKPVENWGYIKEENYGKIK